LYFTQQQMYKKYNNTSSEKQKNSLRAVQCNIQQ